MKCKAVFIVVVALFALMPSASATAQVTTGTLSGIITDQTGGALPGATVSVRNVDTSVTRTVTTDGDGRYRAQALEPGTYEVTVELQGFQKIRRGEIQLSVGQNLALDLTLGVGKMEDVVTVTGEASLIDTTRSSVAAVVDARQIRELPLNGRDFSQLTLLQPGVLASPTTARQVDRGMGTQVSIAGARPNQISYQLDGTDVNFQGNGSPGSAAGGLLGVETVREFQVLINNYSAEYGRSSGGIVTAVTRSGTNSLRGSAFEFFRDESLDARNYFDDPNSEKPPLSRNQFGGYLGGPIARERTFFFGSYEGLRQDRGRTSVNRVPSRATQSRSDIAASVRPYIALYPLPNGPESGASGIYSVQVTEPTRENYLIGKIDHTASASHSFSVRYSWDKASVVVPSAIPLFAVDTNTKAQFLVGEHKWIIRPTLLNTVKVAWNKAYEATVNVNRIDVAPVLFFIPNTQFGSIGVSTLDPIGTDTNTPTYIDLKSLQIAQSLTWSRGSHNVKTGINFTRWFNDQDSSFTIGGRYAFSSIENFVKGIAGTFEGQAPGSTTDRKWRQSLVGIFLQDDWSVRRNITINGGVRYEFITVPTEEGGRVGTFPDLYASAPRTDLPLFDNPSLGNVAPRVGVNWKIDGKGKNVIQAGGGMFYEPILSNVYRAYGNRTPPYYNTINPNNPPFPNPTGAGATTALSRLDLLEYDLKNPYRVQYNATYQREVLPQTVVTVGFLGARGYNQIRNIEWNQSVPQVLADGSYLFPAVRARRNPNFGSMRLRITDGRSWYKALIVGGSRRFSNNLALQASYTFGKSEDLGSQAVGSGDFDNSFQPAYGHDPYSNKGLSDYDVRHNFVFNYTWTLPAGPLGSGFAKALTSGWQIAGIVSMRSGVPFSPELSFDRANAFPRSGGAGQRPNLAPGASSNPVLGDPHQYFDPFAFELPAARTLGNLPRNTIIGPGYATWDGSVIKNFALGGQRRAQFRFEAFNLLNRANFGLPARIVFDSATTRAANAGEITNTVTPGRQFQLGLKLEF